jgi:hypothetical protein
MKQKEAYEHLKAQSPEAAQLLESDHAPDWVSNLIAELGKLYDKGYEAAARHNEQLR